MVAQGLSRAPIGGRSLYPLQVRPACITHACPQRTPGLQVGSSLVCRRAQPICVKCLVGLRIAQVAKFAYRTCTICRLCFLCSLSCLNNQIKGLKVYLYTLNPLTAKFKLFRLHRTHRTLIQRHPPDHCPPLWCSRSPKCCTGASRRPIRSERPPRIPCFLQPYVFPKHPNLLYSPSP